MHSRLARYERGFNHRPRRGFYTLTSIAAAGDKFLEELEISMSYNVLAAFFFDSARGYRARVRFSVLWRYLSERPIGVSDMRLLSQTGD